MANEKTRFPYLRGVIQRLQHHIKPDVLRDLHREQHDTPCRKQKRVSLFEYIS